MKRWAYLCVRAVWGDARELPRGVRGQGRVWIRDGAESSAVRISQLPSTARVVIVPFSVTGANATLTMTLGTDGGSPGEPGVDPCVQSGEANQGQAFVDPEVLMDFTILGPQALYGVFVHFNQGSQKWQDGLLTSLGLTVVKDFRKYVPAVYVTGPVAVLQTLITLPAVSRLEYNEPLQYLGATQSWACLLYPSDAADDPLWVVPGGLRHSQKKPIT